MSAERTFLDTNVLVYAFDGADPVRQGIAAAVLEQEIEGGTGVVSVQVLRELYVTLTRKVQPPVAASEAARQVDRVASVLVVVEESVEVLRDGLELCARSRMSPWDAWIVAAAAAAGCLRLLTEDLQHGATHLGVRVEDPFRKSRK
jgi:predicted nucleic acid-binding protein